MNYKLILALLDANTIAVRLNLLQVSEDIVGGMTTITCDDGSTVECSAGTFGCFDGSETLCPASEPEFIVGGPITITCDDGSTRTCSAGTFGCTDGSETLCGTENTVLIAPAPEIILGGPTTITCPDGSTVECSAGTFGCFDGSETLCGSAEATVVGLTEEQALADADAMEGTTVTELTTTTTTTTSTEQADLEAVVMGQFFDTPMTITSEGEVEMEDPNVTRTFVRDTEISGDFMIVETETTTTTVNDDGTETVVVTDSLEVFRDGELMQSLETVVSEMTQPTTKMFVAPEGE